MISKKYNTVCIILAIVIVILVGYAVFNKGKLWGEQENYQKCSVLAAASTCMNNRDTWTCTNYNPKGCCTGGTCTPSCPTSAVAVSSCGAAGCKTRCPNNANKCIECNPSCVAKTCGSEGCKTRCSSNSNICIECNTPTSFGTPTSFVIGGLNCPSGTFWNASTNQCVTI